MIRCSAPPRRARGGFTLIEVVGALVVFSVGVIMLLQITSSLAARLEWSALNSLVAAEGQERLDSLDAVAYGSLAVGSDVDTLTFRGVAYRRMQTVTQFTTLVRAAQVVLEPVDGDGPTFEGNVLSTAGW